MHIFNNRLTKNMATIVSIFTIFLVSGCGGGGGGSPPTGTTPQTLDVTINWAANNETRLNSAGGGYNVYYSQTSGFAITDGGVTKVNIPWVSGTAPTSTILLNITSGTYYVRIAGYTSFPVVDTASAPSAQITFTVPFVLP